MDVIKMQLTNSGDRPLTLNIEPWGHGVDVEPDAIFDIQLESDAPDAILIGAAPNYMAFWIQGTAPARVAVSQKGKVLMDYSTADF